MKKCPKWWCFFGFILSSKLAIYLKNFRSFEIVQLIGKYSKYEEVKNDSKFKILKNLVMELKNANPNGCNVVINNLHPLILFFSKILKIE